MRNPITKQVINNITESTGDNHAQVTNRRDEYGLERLTNFPLSLRLIREIHGKLLENVRGAQRDPGEFRRTQNWIGPGGCTLATATFVPPPVPEMKGGGAARIDRGGRPLRTRG
ncbi:MAG: hypothetical protein QOE70_4530 [Chthoniobacter sp.]|jgi:Fic family protein|nr:hypothetical protein [Chthoniobacter sp.]